MHHLKTIIHNSNRLCDATRVLHMKLSKTISMAFLLVTFLSPTLNVHGQVLIWDPVGDGIHYHKYELPGPNVAHVARLVRANPNAIIESSIAQGKLSEGLETVRGMAERYNQAINTWGQSWGSRNKVVVAINGFYYDTKTGIPRSGQVHSGWYAKRFDNLIGESGFAWKHNRSVFIGRCVTHYPERQFIYHPATEAKIDIDGINIRRPTNKLILYTPQYDVATGTDDTGIEILVEMTRPTLILPAPSYSIGFIREIRDHQGSTGIPFDHVVLSAHGSKAEALTSLRVGDEIRISQEITHFDKDCQTRYSMDWTKTYASIGGAYQFLVNGKIVHYADEGAVNRHPRTAIAFNDSYVFFIVVDGRDPEYSIGMTIDELALFARDTLGATSAVAEDGGGSSTMVINGMVVNRPNADLENHRVYLPFVAKESDSTQSSRVIEENAGGVGLMESPAIERTVANGMMMVVVQPMEKSNAFAVGDHVVSNTDLEIRLGPGTNYAVLATSPVGLEGVILNHRNGLNGVFAKGSYWWKVLFNDAEGWVTEECLSPIHSP